MFRALTLTAVLLLISSCLFGQQDARGTVTGRVTDATGANLPNADVRVANVATGVGVSAKSNSEGSFTVPYVLPGMYTVTVEAAGFRKFIRENVQVRVGDIVAVDVQMVVGDVSETVQVTAETPLLSTSEASLGQVVDERRILELPLVSGNAMEFALLAPGTTNGTDMRLRKAPFNNAPSQFSTDGSGLFNNEFTIDGVVNTFSDGVNVRVAFSPPQASLAEFKVQTSVFDASLGHTTGSVVNISTKGGTNDIHGSLWHWLRHSSLDTPTLFQKRANQSLPVYQDNRYGVAAGGPVVIPKLYNGKNKTFWYWTWEANKFGDPSGGAITSTVPRDNWKNGDFSDLLALGPSYQLYDPATIRLEANGRYSRQPFPGNIIPANRINPVGRAILNLYPSPNQTGTATADGRNNYFISGKALEDYWSTIGRFDHTFSDKDRIFVRLHRDYWQEDKNRSFGNDINGLILNRINRGIALDEVHMFSPTFILNFRYGFAQQEFLEHRVSQGFDLTSLGFSPAFASLFPAGNSAIPNVTAGSLTQLSQSESGDGAAASLVHTFTGNFSNIRGAHTLKFGPEFRVYRVFSDRHSGDNSPLLNFNNNGNPWTRGPLDTSAIPPAGAEIASLLLGIPNGTATRTGSFATQDKYFAAYFQDDWKVTTKLTLNLGLRMEYETPVTERYDRSATQFLAGATNPISGAATAAYAASYATSPVAELPVSAFRVNGGLAFAGTDGRNFWNKTGVMWQPRIGLAYQFRRGTVIRSGYGMFYNSLGSFKTVANLAGFTQTTPIEPTPDNGLTFNRTLQNPLPNGILNPAGPAGGLSTNLGQAITFFPLDRKIPFAQRWSFGIEQEIKGGWVVETSYVGNRGSRLPVTRNINGTPAQYLSTSPARDVATINYLATQFPNPFFGLNPQYTSATISRADLLRPYPQFGNITYQDPAGYSWYHSLQSRVEKRFAQGFTLQLSHTWSKAMQATEFLNPTDPMPYETISDLDRAQRIAGSGIWELPFGRGRKWGNQMSKPLNFIAGGWQISGAVQRQSGQPINWGQMLITGDPNSIVLPSDQRTADRWFNTSVFDTRTASALASNLRTFPLRFSNLRFDSQRRWDFSLNKSFPINERFNMRLRGDVFNALNEVVLRGPEASATNSAFGRVSAQEPPRSFQVSLQLQF